MLQQLGKNAKQAERYLMTASTEDKNKALKEIAQALRDHAGEIIAANKIDLENGEKNGMPQSIADRLKLDDERIEGMAKGVMDIVALDDPVKNPKGFYAARRNRSDF